MLTLGVAGIVTVTVAPAVPSVPLRVTCVPLAAHDTRAAPELCVPSDVVENEKMCPELDASDTSKT